MEIVKLPCGVHIVCDFASGPIVPPAVAREIRILKRVGWLEEEAARAAADLNNSLAAAWFFRALAENNKLRRAVA